MKIQVENGYKGKRKLEPFEAKICDLQPGTLVKDVKGHPEVIYIKVNKNEVWDCVKLNWTPGRCILMNINRGSLRTVDQNYIVTVVDGVLQLQKVDSSLYMRELR